MSREKAVPFPQHWHVAAYWYVGIDENQNFQWSTNIEVVSNDVTLALSYMKRQVAALPGPQRFNSHVRDLRLCHDVTHLENLPKELLA